MPYQKKKYTPRNSKSFEKKVANIARETINSKIESKHTDRSAQLTPDWNGVGTVLNLCSITQGVAENQRVGEKLTCTKLQGKFAVYWNAAGVSVQQCRIMIVRDSQCQGTLLTVPQVLANMGTIRAPISNLNVSIPGRYKVLYDRMVTVSDDKECATLMINKALNNITHYTGPLSTNEAKGQLLLMMCSNVSVAGPTVEFTTRLYYKDA